jgi:hypothetical protein
VAAVTPSPTIYDAMTPADRARLAALEGRAEVCEREAAVCRHEAGRIRRHYERMVAVFGLEACAAHARRGTEIIEVP